MTTQAAQRNPSITASDAVGGQDTALDRRRDTWQTAQQTATAAKARVADLDTKLDTNDTQRTEHETALQVALDRQAELKTMIKAATKERNRLRAARKQADRDAVTASQRAKAAEAKYDKALLAEMLRQQKDTDLSAHDGTATPTTAQTTDRPAKKAPPRRRPARTSAQPSDTTKASTSTVARSTPRRTAAAATARKARS